MINPITKELDRETAKFIRDLINKNWEWIVSGFLLLLFYFSDDPNFKLFLGGILCLFIGFKRFYWEGIKQKNNYLVFAGISTIYIGIGLLFVRFILGYNVNIFISLILIIFCCMLLAYSLFMDTFDKQTNLVILPTLTFTFLAEIFTMKAVMNAIKNVGFSGGWVYFSSVVFFLSMVFVCFLIFKIIFSSLKTMINYNYNLFNKYFYLFLSIATTILIGGFFYIQNSTRDPLETFLIVLSSAFVTAFAVVSSVKSINDNH